MDHELSAESTLRVSNPHAEGFLRRYRVSGGAFPVITLIDPRTSELLWEHLGAITPAAMLVRGGRGAGAPRRQHTQQAPTPPPPLRRSGAPARVDH